MLANGADQSFDPKKIVRALAVVSGIVVATGPARAETVIYVDGHAGGPIHDGSSWCNAYIYLQDALIAAAESRGVITEIRVANATYKSDQTARWSAGGGEATFKLANGVTVKAGYAGCGAPDPDKRDVVPRETLNGQDTLEVPRTAPEPLDMVVEPAAVLTWRELVELESRRGVVERPTLSPAPLMPLPPPRLVEVPGLQQSIARQGRTCTDGPASTPRAGHPSRSSEAQTSTALPSPSFRALPDPGYAIPPDTNGAVGPDHVMTMLNSQVRIQDKGGAVVVPDVSLYTFWASTGVFDVFHPKLIYDPTDGRWMATCNAEQGFPDSSVLFAISATSDPTGTWTFYRIDADPTDRYWANFPDIGFNPTWIAITNNMYPVDGCGFAGAGMWVIEKGSALSGGALTLRAFAPGFDRSGNVWGHSLSPCTTFDTGGLAVIYLYIVDNSGWIDMYGRHRLRLSRITGSSPSSPWWYVVPVGSGPVNGLFNVDHNFASSQIGAAQLGTSVRVETNDPRMLNAVFRNGTIWCTHSGGLPAGALYVDRTGVFWYQLDPYAMPNPIVQSGFFDGGLDVHHFFPSITANAVDDAFIGFSRSDPTRYVEAVFSGRLGSDPPGVMDPISVLKAGEDSYEGNYGWAWWGYYSSTVVDPSDDLGFWTIQEYAAFDVGPGPFDDRWGTWWGATGVSVHGACCLEGDCLGVMEFADCQSLGGRLFADRDCSTVVCPHISTSCSQAVEVSCNSSASFDNTTIVNAPDPGYTCGLWNYHEGSVWFKFTATETAATISTCDSVARDSTLGVYDGTCEALTEIGCSEDDCESDPYLSNVCVKDLSVGNTYYIQVSAWSVLERGSYTLEVDCHCSPPSAPSPDPLVTDRGHGTRSRYLSFAAGSPGRRQAIRVTFADLAPPFTSLEGLTMWVAQPQEVTEKSGKVNPAEAPGHPTFTAATLQCDPLYRDWSSDGIVHVYHQGIIPGATYEIQAIEDGCPWSDENNYSPPLIVTTSRWGDVVKSCATVQCRPPDGRVDMTTDVTALLDKFKNLEGAPGKSRCDLGPDVPNLKIDMADVTYVLDAFRGFDYPLDGPTACPPTR